MKKILPLILTFLILSCDDGDIITTQLDFTEIDLNSCPIITNGTSFNHTFYKLNTENQEGLVLTLNTTDNILEAGVTHGPYSINTTNVFEFRKFNGVPASNYFCSSIPPASPGINEVFAASNGTFTIQTVISFEDDEDGIPREIENAAGINQDFDGDGILNYRDFDDDGDNVPTSEEGVLVVDGAIDVLNSWDDDNDGILNYLDPDDDGDGIPTKQEDLNRNLNPADDFSPNQILPNYRLSNITIEAIPAVVERRVHEVKQTKSQSIVLNNVTLSNGPEQLVYENYVLGIFVRPTETVSAEM